MYKCAEILGKLMAGPPKISANALAGYTGVPQPTITRIKNGKVKDPDTETLMKLGRHFGHTVAEMRGDDQIPESERVILSPEEREMIKALRALPKKQLLKLQMAFTLFMLAYGPHVSDGRLREWKAPSEKV